VEKKKKMVEKKEKKKKKKKKKKEKKQRGIEALDTVLRAAAYDPHPRIFDH